MKCCDKPLFAYFLSFTLLYILIAMFSKKGLGLLAVALATQTCAAATTKASDAHATCKKTTVAIL